MQNKVSLKFITRKKNRKRKKCIQRTYIGIRLATEGFLDRLKRSIPVDRDCCGYSVEATEKGQMVERRTECLVLYLWHFSRWNSSIQTKQKNSCNLWEKKRKKKSFIFPYKYPTLTHSNSSHNINTISIQNV